jgi:hypothetical protein
LSKRLPLFKPGVKGFAQLSHNRVYHLPEDAAGAAMETAGLEGGEWDGKG